MSLPYEPPLWPYTWGRVFRLFALPFDVLYRLIVTRTVSLASEHLARLPSGRPVIFAGTHHGFPDMPLVRWGIGHSPAGRFAQRVAVVAGAEGFPSAGWYARFAVLAFGLFPLQRYGAHGGSLARLARLTSEGNALLIFPQGQHARPEQERAGDRTSGSVPVSATWLPVSTRWLCLSELPGPRRSCRPTSRRSRALSSPASRWHGPAGRWRSPSVSRSRSSATKRPTTSRRDSR